jgi:hypothetical protein
MTSEAGDSQVQPSREERMSSVWRDYVRYEGSRPDPTEAQPPTGRALAFCVIRHFGRHPELLGTNIVDPDWDPCLPELGTADYDAIYFVVHTAEVIIGDKPGPWDPRLNDYLHGFRTNGVRPDYGMNRYWSSPLDVIDGSQEMREGFIAKLKAATLGMQTGT